MSVTDGLGVCHETLLKMDTMFGSIDGTFVKQPLNYRIFHLNL